MPVPKGIRPTLSKHRLEVSITTVDMQYLFVMVSGQLHTLIIYHHTNRVTYIDRVPNTFRFVE